MNVINDSLERLLACWERTGDEDTNLSTHAMCRTEPVVSFARRIGLAAPTVSFKPQSGARESAAAKIRNVDRSWTNAMSE